MISPSIILLDEPKLEFRYGQRATDPHIGLGLFGPPDTDEPGRPHGVAYAVIGAEPGPSGFLKFAEMARRPVVSCAYGDPDVLSNDRALWPAFPGFEAAFCIEWPHGAAWVGRVDRQGCA